MGSRKENLKKSLGISEYPWSSDDDDEPETGVAEPSTRRQSHFDMAGTSGTGSSSAPAAPPDEQNQAQARFDRDVFWRLLSNPRRVPSISLPRNSSTRVDVPLSLISRAPSRSSSQPPEPQHPSDAHQRIMAIRRLNRSFSWRPCHSIKSFNMLSAQQQQRAARSSCDPSSSVLGDPSFAVVRDRGDRRDRPRGEVEATFSDSYSVEGLPPSEPRQSPPRDEPVNVDPSDDDEEIEIEPALSSPSQLRTEEAAEQNGNDTIDAEGAENMNLSGVALEEEIVEIDVEPEEPGPANSAPPHPQIRHEEPAPAPSTSSGNMEPQPHGTKRKHESSDESEPASVKEFNQSLLRLLECPVCLEWMEPPMSQCRRGHLVCGRCRARLQACPVCRTAFSSVRNRAMEGVADMLRYPCRHGCGREVRLRRRGPHEASCGARRYRCVVPACAERPPLPRADLAHHFQSKHLSILKMGRKHKFSLKVNAELHENWVIMALRELFHLRVDVDVRTWGVVVYAAYIGPKCYANSFTYEVTVVGQYNSRKLTYTRATHCDLECSSLNVSRQDCFHLTLDQALNFLRVKNRHCEPDEFLHFTVEITKCENSQREDSDS